MTKVANDSHTYKQQFKKIDTLHHLLIKITRKISPLL